MLPATQDRSRATGERILCAAERLVEKKPLSDLSVAEIAAEARVSVGGFYGRFESKEALLIVLHERYEKYRNVFFKEMLAEDNWYGCDLKERVRTVAGAIVALMSERRGMLKSFLLRYWANPDAMSTITRNDIDQAYKLAKNLILTARDEICAPDPGQACDMALAVASGASRDIIVMKPEGSPGAVTRRYDLLVDTLTDAMMGILGAPGTKDEL